MATRFLKLSRAERLDTALTGWWTVPGLPGVKDALRPDTQQRGTPFAWWLLGTRRTWRG